MNNLIKLFEYEGNQVTFRNTEGVVYVNATQMAKPFGNEKRPQFFLGNQNTKDFIDALSKARNLASADLVKVKKGGNEQGTWMHEDVAIEFSRWLSPAFAIWCNDCIKELLTTGSTSLMSDEEMTLTVIHKLSQTVEAQKAELLETKTKLVKVQPTVDYVRDVLKSESTYTTTQVASELGLTANKLNIILRDKGVQRRVNGTWVLYAKYIGNGYTKSNTIVYPSNNHGIQTHMNTVWTEKGRLFIHTLVNPVMIESLNKRSLALNPLN